MAMLAGIANITLIPRLPASFSNTTRLEHCGQEPWDPPLRIGHPEPLSATIGLNHRLELLIWSERRTVLQL